MSDMKLDLTKNQINALLRGRGIQLKPHQIGRGKSLPSNFPSRHMKALKKAMKNQKGMRLKFEPYEMEGAGIFDFLKDAASMVINPLKQITGPVVKTLAPVLKPVAKALAPEISKRTGIPQDIVNAGIDIGSTLAGNGIVRGRGRVQLSSDSNTMMSPLHPVMKFQPQFVGHDVRRTIGTKQGGGIIFNPSQFQNNFVPANRTGGVGFRPAGY